MTAARNAAASEGRPPFSVEMFRAFWSAPDFDRAGDVLASDARAYWPGRREPLVGLERYEAPLRCLLQRVPDFHLEVADHATRGEVTFIRWIAHGTWRGEPLGFEGVDCIRQRNGQVIENRIFCTHPLIEEILADTGV